MSDLMTFPDTVEEFMEQYKIIDTEQVYTNGAELVPIFRMKQWFEHLPTAEPGLSEDDKEVIRIHLGAIKEELCNQRRWNEAQEYVGIIERLDGLPTAEPRKGKWVSLDDFRGKYNDYGYKCSKCDEHLDYEANYCPNCGARMEES